MEYKGIKLPNYFSPKWANHSIYNGLRVIVFVRNMERKSKPNYSYLKIFDLFDLFRKIEPLILLAFTRVCRQIEIFLI